VIALLPRSVDPGTALQLDWGDGSATASPLLVHRRHQFLVRGSHTYDQTGQYRILLQQSTTTGGTGSQTIFTCDAVIGHPPYSSRTIKLVAPTLVQQTVDEPVYPSLVKLTGVPGTIRSAKTHLDWGDGSVYDFVSDNYDGQVLANLYHTYTTPGNYAFAVTFKAGRTQLGAFHQEVIVGQNSPGGLSLSATTGARFEGTIGSFTAITTAIPKKVGIEWGDDTRSLATFVAKGDNQYEVTGAHTYATPGSYRVHAVVSFGLPIFRLPGGPPPPGSPLLLMPMPSAAGSAPIGGQDVTVPLDSTMTVSGNPLTLPPPNVQAIGLPVPDAPSGTLNDVPLAELDGFPFDPLSAQVYGEVAWSDGTLDFPSSIAATYENGHYLIRASQSYGVYASNGTFIPTGGTFNISVTFRLNDHDDTTQNTILGVAHTTVFVQPPSAG
jgi:hypothetical protein